MFDRYIAPRAAISAAQRKTLQTVYGDRVLAIVTVADTLTGYKNCEILRSAVPGARKVGDLFESAHFVDQYEGFHLGGLRIDHFIRGGRSYEDALFTLWIGYPPTGSDEVTAMRDALEGARSAILSGPIWDEVIRFIDASCGSGSPTPDVLEVLVGVLAYLSRFSQMGNLIDDDRMQEITLRDRFDEWLFLQSAAGLFAPAIYRRLYGLGAAIKPSSGRSYSEAFVEALGVAESEARIKELGSVFDMLFITMLYHGPGNGSTFSGLVANSFGPPLSHSMISMMGALLGPNHGKASTLGIRFLYGLKEHFSNGWSSEAMEEFARDRVLVKRKPAWCVGHALLKLPPGADPETFLGDPRTAALTEWLTAKHGSDPFFLLAKGWYDTVSPIVGKEIGARFPKPNVDAYSGLVLALEGVIRSIEQSSFIGAVFGVSRIAGACAEGFYQVAGSNGKPGPLRPGDIRDEEIPSRAKKGDLTV
jgi:citrate synthase